MAEDDELAQLRARRLAELKQGSSRSGGGGGMEMGGGPQQQQQQQAQQQAQKEEMKRNILYQILSPEARERLSRIKIVKPDKAGWVEDMLIQMAQGGQIRGKVSEKELIDLLSQVAAESGKKAGSITLARRSALEDSDDEWAS